VAAAKARGGPIPFAAVVRWPAWALALLALVSAFAPMTPEFMRGLKWALCLFAVLEAGMCLGQSRRVPFLVYAALAVLVNPFQPFHFPPQVWRLLLAGAGLWLIADHLSGGKS